MSREEHLRELVRQGQALRQEDIDHGAKQQRERTVKWMEQYIPDPHLEHEECDDCFVIRSIIAWLKEE
jgi:hypothetical protein